VVGVCVLVLASYVGARAQPQAQSPSGGATPAQPEPKVPADALGRHTPRGTVLGFLAAARNGDEEIARQYLDTGTSGADNGELSRQLFVVLDVRLPPRLRQLSDAPEGSRTNPLRPDQEIVGTIRSARGDVDVVLERLPLGQGGPIWLFSQTTLASVPALYEDVALGWSIGVLPRFMIRTRVAGIRLFEWIAVLLGMPLIYLVTVLLNKLLTPLIRRLWRRVQSIRPVCTGCAANACPPAHPVARNPLVRVQPAVFTAGAAVLVQRGDPAHHRRRRLAVHRHQR
jgi:MscS family membrane protein